MAVLKELKLKYSRRKVKDDLLNKPVRTPRRIYELFREMQNEAREKLVCIHLNVKKEILYYEIVSIGTAHETLTDPSEIFKGAIVVRADSIILVHNHPSGNPEPSPEDLRVADEVLKAGKVLKIELADFIIIGDNKYFSFSDKNMLI